MPDLRARALERVSEFRRDGESRKTQTNLSLSYDALECHGDGLAAVISREPRGPRPLGVPVPGGFKAVLLPRNNRDVINARRTLIAALAGIGPLGMRRHHPRCGHPHSRRGMKARGVTVTHVTDVLTNSRSEFRKRPEMRTPN